MSSAGRHAVAQTRATDVIADRKSSQASQAAANSPQDVLPRASSDVLVVRNGLERHAHGPGSLVPTFRRRPYRHARRTRAAAFGGRRWHGSAGCLFLISRPAGAAVWDGFTPQREVLQVR